MKLYFLVTISLVSCILFLYKSVTVPLTSGGNWQVAKPAGKGGTEHVIVFVKENERLAIVKGEIDG